MNERLQQLQSELEKGRQRMQVLERERLEVRDTMLRISGAIRVLEELLQQEDSSQHNPVALSSVA
jgi:hypothetical protein